MIYIRHLGAAPDDIEKDFDAALIRTHALTLASETLREAQVDLAHVERSQTIRRLTASGATSLNSSSRFASDGNSGFQVLWRTVSASSAEEIALATTRLSCCCAPLF